MVGQYVDQTTALTNGRVYTQHLFVQGSDQPLKITMACTDVQAPWAAIPALVGDLDLEVVGPDGTVYRGNQFAAGESVPNATTTDKINNVEAVTLSQPLPGDYTVRVRGTSIVEDALLATTAIDQDFALVISGDLSRPNTGLILIDRTNYTAPSSIQLEVLDGSRAGLASVSVNVSSTTEPLGETYHLNAAGNYGLFTGSGPVWRAPAAMNGKLETCTMATSLRLLTWIPLEPRA